MKIFMLLFVVLFVLCCSGRPIEPEEPKPTPEIKDTDLCDDAEEKLKELGCLDRRGDPLWKNRKGEEFSDLCRIIQDVGKIYLNPGCILYSKNCEEVLECTSM